MIYCPSCGTGNRDGSRFCNECGTKLPTMTSSLCPVCGALNPPHSLFCEKCGTRLIASLAEESGESEAPAPSAVVPKGLSLPTKSPTESELAAAPVPEQPQKSDTPSASADEETPDWMQVVQSAVADTSESDIAKAATASGTSDQGAPEEVPAWLSDLGLGEQPAQLKKSPTDELLPEWTQRLRTMPEAAQPAASEEDIPDWLKALGTTGQLPASEEPTPAAPQETPAFLANLGASTEPPAAEEEELPEWLNEPPSPYFSAAPSETPLPSTPQAPPTDEDMPDWLRDLHPAGGVEDALPDWLDELGVEEPSAPESTALSTGDSALDWLSQLGATAPEQPSDQATAPKAETPAEAAIAPDWLSSLRAAAPEVDEQPTEEEQLPESISAQKPVTDWLSALRQSAPEIEAEQSQIEEPPEWLRDESGIAPQAIGGVRSYDQEAPDWLGEAGAVESPSVAQAPEEIPEWLRESGESLESTETPPEEPEEEVPDWLKGLGVAGAATAGALAAKEQPEDVTPQKPVTDWLSALRQATPELEAEQAQAEEEPEWLHDDSGIAPQAIGGMQGYEQEVPDWLREAGAAAQPPSTSKEEEIPEWSHEARAATEATEEPSTQPEEEGVPDWLKDLGVVATGAAAASALTEEQQPEEAAPQKPATDWLTALRRATPEIEAEQASEEEEPEWLREEEPGAAPQAIGGPQAYDQEVPDWLREASSKPAFHVEEEGVPDWLRDESGTAPEATQPPVAAQAKEDEGIPDWLKGLGGMAVGAAAMAATPRKEEPADEGMPDWLREAEPTPASAFEAPQAEETAPGEMPDWLREMTPATVTAAAESEAKGTEEIGQPEEAAEAEPERESWVSRAAPVAAAGLAAATVAGKRAEDAEPVPPEMPEWLKEIQREQQAAKTAIPVPPPEDSGLTQGEIPSWLEALRPKEEPAATAEALTPSETEGPLAGIANALPPAPIMGEMHGLPAKLQFAVSAEDQARAGVLKELLTQHAVAPASVEQFVVKGSVIRRRALRWIVTALIATALIVPVWFDINQLTGLPLLPSATNLVPSPAVMPAVGSAAAAIAQLAQMPAGSKVLVVFDYDAAQAGELNRVASALLKSPALRNVQLEAASLNPQGSAVAQAVFATLPGLQYSNLGFSPGQVNGVQSLLAKSGDVKLIIELAASPDTVRWWVEQLQASQSRIPLVVGISAGAEPLTMPYLQSGQVSGLVSGFPGAVAYLNATGMMNTYSQDQIKDYQIPLEALTLANYVMVGLIIIGLIGALLRGAGRRPA